MSLDRFAHRPTAALAIVALLTGCGGGAGERPAAPDPRPADAAPAEPPPRSARTLPIPGSASAPPTDPHTDAAAVRWTVPPGWVELEPSSSMRVAQYRVPGPSGDGECVVYYFGPGQGGDPAANATRWANQFEQPDGRSSVEAMQVTEVEGGRLAVHVVEVTGTYDGGMTMTDAPAEKQPGAMLLGGIAQGPDAPWFFKLTGPEATVRAQREAFVAMMKSVGVGEP
jgi:hypothetical protein